MEIEIETVTITAKPRQLQGTWTVMDDKEMWVRKAYHGEWAVDIPWNMWREVIAWCNVTFGECGHNRRYRWRQNYRNDMARIFLRNESDVTLFRLRWC